MEYVYNNYDEACQFAESSAATVRDEFSWERCAERFVEAVGRDRLEAPYTGSRVWTKPEPKRFLVRVLRPWRAEVCNTVYQFEPGKDYFETADLKRIIHEVGGVLDPSCVVGDPTGDLSLQESGLAPEQLERMGDYSAAHGHCWQCGQELNQGVRHEPEMA
jgi:hypothetical protein